MQALEISATCRDDENQAAQAEKPSFLRPAFDPTPEREVEETSRVPEISLRMLQSIFQKKKPWGIKSYGMLYYNLCYNSVLFAVVFCCSYGRSIIC